MSTSVSVRELKNSLARYLRLAAAGESIVVCDRGRPLAILSAAPDCSPTPPTNAEHLAALAARGLVTLAVGRRRRDTKKPPKADLSGAVIDDRQNRK